MDTGTFLARTLQCGALHPLNTIATPHLRNLKHIYMLTILALSATCETRLCEAIVVSGPKMIYKRQTGRWGIWL